jgi:hypothetical protein
MVKARENRLQTYLYEVERVKNMKPNKKLGF